MKKYSTIDIFKKIENDYVSQLGKRYRLVELNGERAWVDKGLEVVVSEVYPGYIGLFSPQLELEIDVLSGLEEWVEIKEELKIENNNFIKPDIRTGMVVKVRNGGIFLVLVDTIGFRSAYRDETLLINDEYGVMSLNNYNNSLEFKSDSNLDIVEIRKLSAIDEMFDSYEYSELEVLWERQEELASFKSAFEAFYRGGKDIYCLIDSARYDFKTNADKDYKFEEELIGRGRWYIKED